MLSKENSICSLSIAILIAAFMGTASAQVVGTYSGTAADGSFMSFQVESVSGNLEFTNVDVNFLAKCSKPSHTASEGWGFYLGQVLVSGNNAFHSGNDYYDIRGSLKFLNNQKAKGTVTSVTAVFVPGDDPPKKAQFCQSSKQNFTVTLQQGPARVQHGVATVLEKRLTK